ncbi:MAG TPA: oligosaccharide flippase family protein, partial [Anaerolineaceae bacterium]|nr:oligosaccharide flippase family protein [Anaerolineaceae bacterium]
MKRLIERIKAYLRKDPVFSRVLKNTGYLFSSNSISLMLSLVQSIFAARLLGVGSFGLVGIITALVSNVNRLFSFRMGEFIVRFLGKELTSENQVKAGAVVKVS